MLHMRFSLFWVLQYRGDIYCCRNVYYERVAFHITTAQLSICSYVVWSPVTLTLVL